MSKVSLFEQIVIELQEFSDPNKALVLAGFFKTEKGQYGEGDKFIGVTVPNQRKVAVKYANINIDSLLPHLKKLLHSEIHEHRLTALLILTYKFEKSPDDRKLNFDFYIENIKFVNNWDLVDLSAPCIVGGYLLGTSRDLIYSLAGSSSLWERRISIVSTYKFIKAGEYRDTVEISKMLLNDKHDLIHKAVGWMLREVGKKSLETEKIFLDSYCRKMPRTMLRYAIERFPESERKKYMKA